MSKQIFIRSAKNPIITPLPGSVWESVKTHNPGAILHRGKYYLLYRAVGGAWVSKIGIAESSDGENFVRRRQPIIEPKLPIEKNGVEDPRVTRVGSVFYLTYTAFDGETARLCWAGSFDLENWERLGQMLPDWDGERAGEFIVPWDAAQNNGKGNSRWVKSGGIFPEKINGRYWLLFGDRCLWLASSKDMKRWVPEYEPFIKPRRGYFDSAHVEMGPPPLRTDNGWLVLYHGVDEHMVYRLGYMLLALHNPGQIIKRSNKPIFEPRKPYEISGPADILPGGYKKMETMEAGQLSEFIEKKGVNGEMPQVIFACGAILTDGVLRLYYGAGDAVIGTAAANLKEIIRSD